MIWTFSAYRRLVRFSAGYDLLATAAFVTSWSFDWLQQQLATLTAGWPGQLPPFAPMHTLNGEPARFDRLRLGSASLE